MKRFNLAGAIVALCVACSISANELPAQPVAATEGTNMVSTSPFTLTSVWVRYIYDTNGYKGYAAFVYDQNHEVIPTSYDTDYEISWYTFSEGFGYPNFINMEFNTLGRTNPMDNTILSATECNSSVSAAQAWLINSPPRSASVRMPSLRIRPAR